MSWQVRHEGSPTATSGLSAQQVLEGVGEGVWETTDEVRGPGDAGWKPIETHPHFEEAIAEMELPQRHHDEETHLDMNPLIDVALVLLIFFILTTSYDALRSVIDMPQMSSKGQGPKQISAEQAKNEFIRAEARLVDGKPVVKVDGQECNSQENLKVAMNLAVSQKRTKLIIDAKEVTWDTVVKILDAAKGAKVEKYMMRVDKVE